MRQTTCRSQLESYDRLPIGPRRQEFSTTLMGVTSLENYCRHWGRQLWSSVRGVFVPEVSQSKGLRNVMPQQSQSPKPASRVRTSGRWCRRNPPPHGQTELGRITVTGPQYLKWQALKGHWGPTGERGSDIVRSHMTTREPNRTDMTQRLKAAKRHREVSRQAASYWSARDKSTGVNRRRQVRMGRLHSRPQVTIGRHETVQT